MVNFIDKVEGGVHITEVFHNSSGKIRKECRELCSIVRLGLIVNYSGLKSL